MVRTPRIEAGADDDEVAAGVVAQGADLIHPEAVEVDADGDGRGGASPRPDRSTTQGVVESAGEPSAGMPVEKCVPSVP